jgi:hypothetical protein
MSIGHQPSDLAARQQAKAARIQRNFTPENAWYRLLGLPILAALACGIAPFATGAPLSRSLGIGLTVGVVGWLLVKSMTVTAPNWPAPPATDQQWGRTARHWEVPGLESALERPQHMARRLLVQQHELATEVLARRGLALDSPQARELLGSRIISLLTDPEAKTPNRSELTGISVLLARLASTRSGGVRPLSIPDRLTRGQRQSLLPWSRLQHPTNTHDGEVDR